MVGGTFWNLALWLVAIASFVILGVVACVRLVRHMPAVRSTALVFVIVGQFLTAIAVFGTANARGDSGSWPLLVGGALALIASAALMMFPRPPAQAREGSTTRTTR